MTWSEYKLQSIEDYAVRVQELIGKGWSIERSIKRADREAAEGRFFIDEVNARVVFPSRS